MKQLSKSAMRRARMYEAMPLLKEAVEHCTAHFGHAPTKDDLWSITGGLSNPSKMPGKGWGTSAMRCQRGKVMSGINGTTCAGFDPNVPVGAKLKPTDNPKNGCYAQDGKYIMPNVIECHARRIEAFYADTDLWISAMAMLVSGVYHVNAKPSRYFRFLDSGDLESPEMLAAFAALAMICTKTKFWVPTRQYNHVVKYHAMGGVIPANMVVRISCDMHDALPPKRVLRDGVCASNVLREMTDAELAAAGGYACPATQKGKPSTCLGNKCLSCFSREVPLVGYHNH